MASFDLAVGYVLSREGGFVNNSMDPGGATNMGISLRLLKSLSPEILKLAGLANTNLEEAIQHLAPSTAKIIYQQIFWNSASFMEISRQDVCNYLFDFAVNAGIATAVKAIQRACWAVLGKWELLPDDGVLGEKTFALINQAGMFLLPALRAERGNYYRDIINHKPEEKEFLNGWLNRSYNA